MATNILVCKLLVNTRSDASLRAKINEINLLIDELGNTAMKSVLAGNHAEYEMDTGQTRVRIEYTSVASVKKAMQDLEDLAQFYLNKLNRTTGATRLMPENNFKHRR
jgi:hypothetical protein